MLFSIAGQLQTSYRLVQWRSYRSAQEETSRVGTEVSGAKSEAVEKLMKIPVMLKKIQADLTFIVFKNLLFEIFIGRSTTKRIGVLLNLSAAVVSFNYRGQAAFLPMMPEYMRPTDITGAIDSKDFTSKSEEDKDQKGGTRESDEEDQEDFILFLNDDLERSSWMSCRKGGMYPAWAVVAKPSFGREYCWGGQYEITNFERCCFIAVRPWSGWCTFRAFIWAERWVANLLLCMKDGPRHNEVVRK